MELSRCGPTNREDKHALRYRKRAQNIYSYVLGNPLGFIDPNGEKGLIDTVIGTAIGAGLEIAVEAYKNYRNECDIFDMDNYDWADIAISGAVGAVAPGMLKVGKTIANSGGAISALSQQLKNARTASRIVKIESRISDHQTEIAGMVLTQAGFAGGKKLGEMAAGEDKNKIANAKNSVS